jgi:TP901 family phage tail tape measure protein
MSGIDFDIRAINAFGGVFGALTRAIRGAEGDFDGLAARAARVGGSAAIMGAKLSAGLTVPGGVFLADVTKTAAEFETAMLKVAAVSEASDEDLARLSATAREMGAGTAFSAREAADAMAFLAQAGFDVDQTIAAIPSTLNMAAAASMDLATAADVVSNVLTGYGLDISQLPEIVDAMAKAYSSGNTNIEQLGAAMKYAGPIASQLGIDFSNSAAAITLMSNAGIQGEQAGVALRGALSRLINPPKMARDALADMGVAVVDATGKLKPFGEIVADLEPHLSDTAGMMKLFGQEAGPAMLGLLAQGSGALQEMALNFENAGGTAERMAATQMTGFNGKMKQLGSALSEIKLAIADAGLLEAMTEFITLLKGFAQYIGELSPETKKWGLMIIAATVAIGPIVAALGLLVLGVAALASPLGLALVAVAALGVGVAVFWSDIVAIGPMLSDWAVGIGETVSQFTASIVNSLKEMGADAARYVEEMVDKITKLFTEKLNKAFDKVNAGVDTVKSAFFGMWDAVVGNSYVPDMVDGIAAHFGRLDKVMVAPAEAAANKVSGIFDAVKSDIASALGGLAGSAMGGGSFDWRSALGTIGGKAIEAGVNGFFAPAAAPALSPLPGAIPPPPVPTAFQDFSRFLGFAKGGAFSGGVQKFARGGVFDKATGFAMAGGGLGVMGEAGPEAVMPLARGRGGKLGVAVQGGGASVSIGNIDARGATDPAATAAAVRQAVAVAIAAISPTVADMRRRGEV